MKKLNKINKRASKIKHRICESYSIQFLTTQSRPWKQMFYTGSYITKELVSKCLFQFGKREGNHPWKWTFQIRCYTYISGLCFEVVLMQSLPSQILEESNVGIFFFTGSYENTLAWICHFCSICPWFKLWNRKQYF